MARHADPDDRSFRSSLLRAAAGGLAALVVTFGVTGLLTYLGRDDGTGGPAMVAQPTSAPQTPSPEPAAPVSEPPDAEPATSAPTAAPTPQEETESDLADVTVQVLDAVGTGTQAEAAAKVLRDLGYDVVVINNTPRRVEQTTILATRGHEAEAEALRDEDPRFGAIRRNKDFAQSVDLHVLVGPDFAP